jgi:hypothetical protein
MAHIHIIKDEQGDVIDSNYFCSDSCNRLHSKGTYQEWHGCVELEFDDVCINCGTLIKGVYASVDEYYKKKEED